MQFFVCLYYKWKSRKQEMMDGQQMYYRLCKANGGNFDNCRNFWHKLYSSLVTVVRDGIYNDDTYICYHCNMYNHFKTSQEFHTYQIDHQYLYKQPQKFISFLLLPLALLFNWSMKLELLGVGWDSNGKRFGTDEEFSTSYMPFLLLKQQHIITEWQEYY